MADGARPQLGNPLMPRGGPGAGVDLPRCSRTRSWLGEEVEAPGSPPSYHGSYQPSEGTSADSTMAASVSEPSSTAIRVWSDGLFKTVREDGPATPRPGWGPSGLCGAERASPGRRSADEEARVRGALRRRCGQALLWAACLALLAWAACAGAGDLRLGRLLPPGAGAGEARRPLCEDSAAERCPARELFESPEVHNVAAESLMQVGRRLLPQEDRQAVWAAVASGFRNVTAQLDDRAPQVARDLDAIRLTRAQKLAVLASMRLVSLPQVQRVGVAVAEAIRDSGCTARECVQRSIEAKLQPHEGRLRALGGELTPDPLRQLWGRGRHWETTLDPGNIRAFGSAVGRLASQDALEGNETGRASRAPRAALGGAEKSALIFGGVLQQARALLDVVRMCTGLSGRELAAPLWATSLGGAWHDHGPELASCEADAGEGGRARLLKELFCPLRYGVQGVDALRAALGGRPAASAAGP